MGFSKSAMSWKEIWSRPEEAAVGEEEEAHVLEIQIVICIYIPSFEADLQGESSGAGA